MSGRGLWTAVLTLLVWRVLTSPPAVLAVPKVESGVVRIRADGKAGSGFIVRLDPEAAYIMTAAHVVAGVARPYVTFATRPGRPVAARIVGLEGENPRGLALLVVSGNANLFSMLSALPLAPRLPLAQGDAVSVLGFPSVLGTLFTSAGRIGGRKGQDIVFEGAIEGGNSGGPLLKAELVVGLVMERSRLFGRAVSAGRLQEFLYGLGIQLRLLGGQDGKVMVLVPAGCFEMGITDQEADAVYRLAQRHAPQAKPDWFRAEQPAHQVCMDAFYMDRYEVTMQEYRHFVRQTKHRTLSTAVVEYAPGNSYPVLGVSWEDADAYCRWAGKYLPTEAQWEKAARGSDGRRYPWGNAPVDGRRTNYCDSKCDSERNRDTSQNDGFRYAAPAGSYEAGQSPYGIYDLAGNAWEWVWDWYDSGFYSKSPRTNPVNDQQALYRVVRGGGWDASAAFVRTSYRSWNKASRRNRLIGFRCVRAASAIER